MAMPIILPGAGNSVAKLLGTSNGDLKMIINDGAISRGLMEIAGLNVGNYVVGKIFGDEDVKINCAAADLRDQETAWPRTRLFVFDTENAIIYIDGTAQLGHRAAGPENHPGVQGLAPVLAAFAVVRARNRLPTRRRAYKPYRCCCAVPAWWRWV
jgi:AsmA family protein